ncbi:uncharacterized protein LOC135494953 [Lineus longissimus]|uniref:uncharacterized protein LOC135494953 n=1 Tax=Lineus longissimus TaxID=88925 RepID=UPI00315CF7B4
MSSEAKDDTVRQVCTICLTSHVTKIVGTCQHAFCTTCLSKHLKGIGEDSKTFLCPTCKSEYPVPASGVSGFVDCSEDGQTMVKPVAAEGASLQEKSSKCLSCFYRTEDSVQAKNVCIACGDMILCDACTQVHRENKVTKDHVIFPLDWSSRTEEIRCEAHGLLAKDFCFSCSKQVCTLCVQLAHGNHKVRKLDEVFLEVTEEVKTITEEQRIRLSRLRHVGEELKVLKISATEHMDSILRKIEEEAEHRMGQILRQKEALEKQVRNEFKCVDEAMMYMYTIPDLVERIEATVADADKLLAEPAIGVAELEKITTLRESMMTYGNFADQIDDESLWDKYEFLRQSLDFVPDTDKFSIGNISARKAYSINACRLVHEHDCKVDDPADVIPCVAIVGSKYAVAHPTSADRPSTAFDVYAIPGTYERTITEHVSPLYGMTATPDGKVAILSDGSSPDDSCSIRIFDTEAGYVRSSSDIKIRGHVAFDVNMRGQYVILSKEDRYMVTVVRDDGTVVLSHDIDHLDGPRRIAAVGSFYYIMSLTRVAAYRHKKGFMQYITQCNRRWQEPPPHRRHFRVLGQWDHDCLLIFDIKQLRSTPSCI